MKTAIAAIAVLCAVTASAGSLDELKNAAASMGADVSAPVAEPASAPLRLGQGDVENVVCGMDISYRERVTQILPIRLFKKIQGTAKLTCGSKAPVELTIEGGGLALGLGIPNESPFSSVNGVTAGHVQVRMASILLPKDLEGTYVNVGGEVLGGGLSLSPWVNSDFATAVTIYLPSSFNASIGVNLTSLTFKLKR